MVTPILAPAPVFAATDKTDCICVLEGSSGPVGAVTKISGDVFINAVNGQEPAVVGTMLAKDSELAATDTGAATSKFNSGCEVAISASQTLTVSQLDDGLCVQVTGENIVVPTGGDSTGLIVGVLAIGAGGALIVGSGLGNPVSKQ